jgi:hypothetical protein
VAGADTVKVWPASPAAEICAVRLMHVFDNVIFPKTITGPSEPSDQRRASSVGYFAMHILGNTESIGACAITCL